MSLDDFMALTPSEFDAVARAYSEQEERRLHDDWERTRILATIVVQPHLRKKAKPEEILPLRWDHQKKKTPDRDPERDRQRFIELVNKLKHGK